MSKARVRRGVAGLATVLVFGLALFIRGPSRPGSSVQAEQPGKARPEAKPLSMPANLVGLEIALGLKDTEPTGWGGQIQVSEGRVASMRVMRGGNPSVTANRYTARSTRPAQQMMQRPVAPLLQVNLEAPESARVTVETRQGKFSFALAESPTGVVKKYLDGAASVERQVGSFRLTGHDTEDDYPALARSADGSAWLAYVEYQPGKPIVAERVHTGAFDELVPRDHGDCIRLVQFDGQTWYPPIDVTKQNIDVWRPTVSVDGKGRVVVAWAENIDGNWEIMCRRFTPPGKDSKPEWSDAVKVTKTPGSDFGVVSTTDAAGKVWLAWQGFRSGNFEILLASVEDDGHVAEPRIISTSKANDWNPAIAADSKGNVYVAWDTYDKGNYDVMLHVAGKESRTIAVTDSPRFEARPSIVCDAHDRVWIAYEEGDEQWGKDFSTNQFQKIGFKNNPGFALYLNRTIKVKCLVDGQLMQPAGDLAQVLAKVPRKRSLPRLSTDAQGGLWLLYRQHLLPGGAGEVWNSYALRYDGKDWSTPFRLANSADLIDNRPAIVPFGKGILTVYTGDGRIRTQNRDQNDLFAAILNAAGPAQAAAFKPDNAAPPAKLAAVHPDETAAVARMRSYEIETGGKKLHLYRGEFHRHTEYSSHNDGDGLLEDSWRYALDAADLDWMGNGDHDNGFGSEYQWWKIQKTCDLYNNLPRFTAAMTYERSVVYPNGHRNVMMPKRGIRPLPRGDMKGTPEKGTPDVKVLYAYLKHFGGICASHTSGTNMGTDWRDNDPLVEPVVEIYQGHRHNYEHSGAPRAATKETQIGGYEPAGYVWNALEKGYRLGFQSSSDHMSTHISYAVVLGEEPSRQGLIDAFKKRHSYAATDNIILDVRFGEHLMGDEFETNKRPTLEISVIGTAPVAKLHVIRDNKYVYTTEPKAAELKKLRYTDMDAREGKTSYYYVRIEQEDGNLAWASPMWITYKP
jgi:hypothetical protein